MTAEEREKLTTSLEGSVLPAPSRAELVRTLSIWSAVLVVGVLVFGLLGRWMAFSGNVPKGLAVLGVIVATVSSIACMFVSLIRALSAIGQYQAAAWCKTRFEQVHAPVIREALENGRAEVCRVSAVGVIVIEPCTDDFDSIVIYDLGDGTSLFIGEDLYAHGEPLLKLLPSRFDIVRTAAHGLWLGLGNCEGKLEPEVRLCDEECLYGRVLPESESVVPGRPREVLARLGYEKA
jgi:hypothetical protein